MNREKLEILQSLSELLDKERITEEEYNIQKGYILQEQNRFWEFIQRITFGLRSISPQLVILVLVLLFYSPVKNLIKNASEVGFGEVFAVKVEQALRVGNPKLAEKVKSLSREELVTLLDSAQGSYGLSYLNNQDQEISLVPQFKYYIELQKKGLAESDDDLAAIKELIESKVVKRESDTSDAALGTRTQKYYSPDDFTSDEIERIDKVSARLSESGQQVYSLIINVASEEIVDLR
jgi:hypothetical protein